MPYFFFKSGLRVVDVRTTDRDSGWFHRYEGHELEIKHMLIPADTWIEQSGIREEFFAGGGTENEWKEYYALMIEADKITRQQVKDKVFTSSQVPAAIITVAEKP